MQNFVISGKAKTILRLIELKAKQGKHDKERKENRK